MSCCALGTCVDPNCDLCTRVARLVIVRCDGRVTVDGVERPCGLIAGHRGPCRLPRPGKVVRAQRGAQERE